MEDTVEFQTALFKVAFCTMACDGHIHDEEVKELEEMDDKASYFKSVDLSLELQSMLSSFNTSQGKIYQDLLSWIDSEDLSPLRELLILEVALRIANSDGHRDKDEIRFVKFLRSKLKLSNQDIQARFGASVKTFLGEGAKENISQPILKRIDNVSMGIKASSLSKKTR